MPPPSFISQQTFLRLSHFVAKSQHFYSIQQKIQRSVIDHTKRALSPIAFTAKVD